MNQDSESLNLKQRSSIISSLYQNKRITSLIKKAARGKNELFEEELKSNVFLYLCEMEVDKLIRLHNADELLPYVISKIRSGITDFNSSSVNRNIGYVPNRVDNEVELDSGIGYLMDFLKDNNVDRSIDIEAAMAKLNWFEKRVVELYVEYGSIKDIVEHTGTDNGYVVKVINAARKKIKDALH